jgi:hypothetical protein
MTRPRIADDFVVIRARIEEMRRERAQASAEQDGRSVTGTKPDNVKLPKTDCTNSVLALL